MLRTSSGLRTVAAISVRTANGTRTIYSSAPSLTVNPSQAAAYASSKGSPSPYTNNVTVSGYTGTATIAWSVPAGWTVTNQGAATTSFRAPQVAAGNSVSGTGSVSVTTASGTGTATFSLYATNDGGTGGTQ